MIKLPIRLRLTAWYFAVLTVVLSVFGVGAYLEMRHSIHQTVDEELLIRADAIRQMIQGTIQSGEQDKLQEELREHTELRAGGALLQVSDEQGEWLFRSQAMSDYEVPRSLKGSARPVDFVSKDVPLRVWAKEVTAGNHSYLIQVALEMDDFYESLSHFA